MEIRKAISNYYRGQVNGCEPSFRQLDILVVNFRGKDRDIPSLRQRNLLVQFFNSMSCISEPHSIRFTCHMECPAFELVEMLKENCNEGGNVFSCVFSVALSKNAQLIPK